MEISLLGLPSKDVSMISSLSFCQRPRYFKIGHNDIPKTRSNQKRWIWSAGRNLTRPTCANSFPVVFAASTVSPINTTSIRHLPDDLTNATAIVKAGDTEIYILGISHVSKGSVGHIQQLITELKPDVVALELCRDRTGLLIPENAPPPQRFHAPSVTITGYSPKDTNWPTLQQLTSRLKSDVKSSSVTASEIEDDVIELLSSGLFGTVRPVTKACGPNGAPAFMLDSRKNKLIIAAPLRQINFLVSMRKLPPLQDFSFAIEPASTKTLFSEHFLSTIKEETLRNGKVDALGALLGARAALKNTAAAAAAALGSLEKMNLKELSVAFNGVETGKIVAHITSNIGTGEITGLEGTALGGKGIGIQPFIRQAPSDENISSASAAAGAEISAATLSKICENVEIEEWSDIELAYGIENYSSLRSGSSGGGGGGGLAASFAAALTQEYAKYQAAAGRAVGIGTGTAWQAALESAAQCGTQYVYLVDRPASVTGRRLAQGIWKLHSPFLLGAVPAAFAGAIITSSVADSTTPTSLTTLAPTLFAVVVPLAVALWPILAPLLEIQKFSKMSAAGIEDIVKLKEPLQSNKSEIVALYGEDALLKWPGAMDSIINERDEYMAKALVALATSTTAGLTPAYVRRLEKNSIRVHYKYAMPKGGTDPRVCPIGDGDGRFAHPSSLPKKIVAVVGTAHVRGMLKIWPRIRQSESDLSLSEFVE
jgi:pheromone shutdown protein TraB